MNQSINDWLLISQGAEAKVYKLLFFGRPCIMKERMIKSYRLLTLDKKLSHRRLIQEARCMVKCRKEGIYTPCIYFIDEKYKRLYMEEIEGKTIKHTLQNLYCNQNNSYNAICYEIAYNIGMSIAKMHDANIVHGDLTTSNMMIKENQKNVIIIDFGLASSQPILEDKAVDLYVMERAFESTHINSNDLIKEILRAYKNTCRKADSIFTRLSQVRLRGRKKNMIG